MAPFVTSESLTDLPDSIYRCSFSAQTTFAAFRHVDQLRNVPCRQKEEPLAHDVWNIRAPDFAVKHYASPMKKPPRANAHQIEWV